MRYEKQPLTFESQADQLLLRGLEGDRQDLIKRLRTTNYYRFTSYLYAFRDQGENYRPGTSLEQVWDLYRFDHGLRLLLLDALETIEVHARTQLAYHFAHAHDAFAYLNPACLPNFDRTRNDFPTFHVCRYWLAKADAGHSWHHQVSSHFTKHPNIDLRAMGLLPDWQAQPLWNHPS